MAIKDIFLIRTIIKKDGEEKSYWEKMGISFGSNKDGSVNFELFMFPGVKFQIRERKEKYPQQQEPQQEFSNNDEETPF